MLVLAVVASCAARSNMFMLVPGTALLPSGSVAESLFNVEWHSWNPGGGPPGGQPAMPYCSEKYPVCKFDGKDAGLHVGKIDGAIRFRSPAAMLSSTQLECA